MLAGIDKSLDLKVLNPLFTGDAAVMGLEDAREDKVDMPSQDEAVAVVAPGEEGVKKMERGDYFLVNGDRKSSVNSGIATDAVAGDIDMAESQVAVAGSVDSAAEAPVSAGAEPSPGVDTGPACSGDVVDSTEKVESWDLSEAVEESAGNKEDSKPNFSEDGALEHTKTQVSSDLIADAPTSAASVQDSGGGAPLSVPSGDVEERAVTMNSEDAGAVSEELPAEVSASEDVSRIFQDEGSAEKIDSGTPETPLEEVYEAAETRTSAEADKEGAGVEAVLSPSADVEENSDDVEDKVVDVEDKPADVQDKSVDVVDRSIEMNSEDAGTESKESTAEVAAIEELRLKSLHAGSAEKGEIEAPEAPVKEVHEFAEPATHVGPDEAVARLKAAPSPSADAAERIVDIDDNSVDLGDNSVGIEDKSVEVSSEDVGAVSEEKPAEVAGSEEASRQMPNEGSAGTGDSEPHQAPAEEVHEVAEAATSADPDEDLKSLEAAPSPFVDVEERSFELDSKVARALSVDASPKIEDERSHHSQPPSQVTARAEEVDEVFEPITVGEPLEAAPSPFVAVEEKSFELDPEVARAVSEDASPEIDDEGSAERGDSEAPEAPVEEVQEVAEAATSAESDEGVVSLESVPSPSADVAEGPDDGEDTPVDVADKSFGIEDKSVKVNPDGAGAVSTEFPAEPLASEEVSPNIPEEGSAEIGDSAAPEEEDHEGAEATTSAERDEDVATLEAAPSPFVDVEEKSFELDSKAARALSVDASPGIEDEGSAVEKGESDAAAPAEEVNEVFEPINVGEPLEAAPSPFVAVEEKSFELDPEVARAVSEDASLEIEEESSAAEKGESEAHEVAEAATSADPDEDLKSLEAAPSPFVDVEERSFELDSKVARALSVDASPKIEDERSAAENGESEVAARAEEVDEVFEPITVGEPLEAAPSPFVAVEEKSFELDPEVARAVSEDPSPEIDDEGSAEKGESEAPEAPVGEVQEVAEAATSAEPDVDVPSPEAAPSPSADVEEKSVEVEVENPTINSETHEASAILHSIPAPAVDAEDNVVQDVDTNDTSEAREVSSSRSSDQENRSPESLPEGAPDVVGSETRFVPDEDVHEVVEATISAEPDEGPQSALAPSDVAEEESFDLSSEDAIRATTASESIDKEDVSPEPLSEGETSAGADASLVSGDVEGSGSLDSGVDEGSAILEAVPSPATDVQDGPADGSAEKGGIESLFTPAEEVHEVVESTITAESDDGSTFPESGPAPDDSEKEPEESSKETTAELPSESSHDLPGDVVPAPVEEAEKTANAAPDEEPAVLESADFSSEDVQAMPETVSSREFNFNDLKEAGTTSDHPVEDVPAPSEESGENLNGTTDAEPAVLESTAMASSEDVQTMPEILSRDFDSNDLKDLPISDNLTSDKVATAIGEEGSSVDAAARDTTPLETSTPPPASENTESPKSYDLHEVAVHLEDAAEKTLEDLKSSAAGDGKASVAESVAQIILDESSKTEDSSELISGVIQQVGQLAQNDFQSDPNVLPDTVNQVFDREAAGSPADQTSQPKESTSLGTKFSLFVIWCISLCASHVSSKAMPAPALKLGAEEVAAVLHSNAQGAASSQAASSV